MEGLALISEPVSGSAGVFAKTDEFCFSVLRHVPAESTQILQKSPAPQAGPKARNRRTTRDRRPLRTVQAMIAESVRTTVADVPRELMRAGNEGLAAQSVTPASTTSSGMLPNRGALACQLEGKKWLVMFTYTLNHRVHSGPLCKGFRTSEPQRKMMSQSTEMSPLVSMLFQTFLTL